MSNNLKINDEYGHLRELTWRGMILGAIITVVFTASNVYLGLKVGLTFASSIPAAVISMAILRFFPGHNILENNMVQTQASAAGTLSSIIFVIPGLLMLGYWQSFPFWQTTFVCVAGGILGVIFTIPLRHVMVVKSDLPYPEGVAAAEILKAGDVHKDKDGKIAETGIKEIALGGIFAGVFKFCTDGFKIIADSAGYFFKAGSAIFQIPMGFSMALLGAGYLIGIVSGIAILTGLVIAWIVLVPYFSAIADPAVFQGKDIASMAVDIWKDKVRYVGVGTMTVAAVWTLLTLSKPMFEGLANSVRQMRDSKVAAKPSRIEQDMSPKWMLITVLVSFFLLLGTFWSFVGGQTDVSAGLAITLVLVCTIMAFLIGFLVAAACGYMAGLVGSSSSPISGIGIISIIVMSLVLLAIGKGAGLLDTDGGQKFMTALALFTTSVVLAISCISNDNLQDLKTGYLVYATPWKQQVALIIGCVVGALVITPVLEILYKAYGFTGALPRAGMDEAAALSAPQATLMTSIAKGIFNHNLEWTYIITGAVIGVILIVIDFLLKRVNKGALPVLAVGMGIYLPPSINAPIFVGALLSWLVNRHFAKKAAREGKDVAVVTEAHNRRGTLFSAGLIVGESLVGVIIALIIAISVTSGGSEAPLALGWAIPELAKKLAGLVLFVVAIWFLYARVKGAYDDVPKAKRT